MGTLLGIVLLLLQIVIYFVLKNIIDKEGVFTTWTIAFAFNALSFLANVMALLIQRGSRSAEGWNVVAGLLFIGTIVVGFFAISG